MTDRTTHGTTGERRWHQEPLVWLVIAIPALTVFAGLTTVVVANHTADTVVVDDFRKDGLAINQDPRRDEAARRLGVSAEITAADAALRVALAPGRAAAPSKLVVLLSHATRAEHDRMVTLERGADGEYRAAIAPLPAGHWYVEISPADREWRLTSDFRDRALALALRAPAAG